MDSDKRRRARVQGGWAPSVKNKSETGATASASGNRKQTFKSDDDKQKVPAQPAWLGKNADSSPSKKFVYEEPSEVILNKPKESTIEKSGVYDLSLEPSGVSRIRLFANFIDEKESGSIFEELSQELPWRQISEYKNGEEYLQPRLTAWFGDLPYSYSGITHKSNTQWPHLLCQLRERLEANTGLKFNSVLANLYRDGHDHVPWHADDEPGLHENPTIASLSFGDGRMFELRKKPMEQTQLPDYSHCEIITVPLDAGSLLIMEGSTQDDWHHRIPKEYHDRGPRINLTFRVIYPV